MPLRRTPVKSQPTGELALIERIRRRAATLPQGVVQLGIGDDCAVLRPRAGHEICVTTDFSLEGRHFRRDWHSPRSVGHRALARGLSDLAAMGAEPMAGFLSLALPRSVAADAAWIQGFLDGLTRLAAAHECPLAGGDTSQSPSDEVLIDIVLMGSTPRGTALRRSGARAGDGIFVTGTLGGAAHELQMLEENPARFARAKSGAHLFPEPRLAAGKALRARKIATACIDVSDGISTDLAHLCEASGVDAEVDAALLPGAASLRSWSADARLGLVLHGGEDYELLFTARPDTNVPAKIAGVAVTRIGTVLPKRKRASQVWLVRDGSRAPLPRGGWEHFAL